MKLVKFVASHALPALMILFSIMIGITAAIISGCIEYVVIKGILSTTAGDYAISPAIMAFLTVLCLEGTKVFLHIFIGMVKKRGNPNTAPMRTMNGVRIALVLLSIACTFAWTTNILYTDVVNSDDVSYADDIAEINSKYDTEISSLWSNEAAIVENRLQVYVDTAESRLTEYEEYQVKDYSSRAFEQTSAEKKRLGEEAQLASEELREAQTRIPSEVHQELEEKEEQLENKLEAALKSRDAEMTTNQGANAYIHVVLMAVSHYLLQFKTYPTQAYFAVAIVFSTVLSAILEAIITVDLHVVTMAPEELNRLVQADKMSAEMNTALNKLLRAFLVGAVSTLIFLFYCLGMKIDASINTMFYALMIFALVNLLGAYLFPNAEKPKQGAPKVDATSVYNEMVIAVVKACSSFLGFVILGAVFGNDFQELTMSAVGMTLGSVGGQLVKLPEQTEA